MKITSPFNRLFSGGLLSQISALALLITTIILSFFGWQSVQSQTKYLTNSLHTTIEANGQWLATALEQPLYHYDDATISALCNSLLTLPDIVQVTVNHDNKIIVFPITDAPLLQHSSADTISVNMNILHQDMQIGEVQILASSKSLQEQINNTSISSLFQILVLDFFLVTAVIFFLSLKFIKPVDRLQRAAEKIAGGNLEYAINIQSSNELGLLADYLETMRKSLQEKISDLETEVVMRRTADKELKVAKNYIDNIINSMPSLLVGVNSQHKVTQWNRQAEKKSGILSDNAKGKDILTVLPYLIDWQDKIGKAMVNKQVLHEDGCAVESGTGHRYEDITIFPLTNNGVDGAVIRIDDVTEQHQLRLEIAHSRKLDAIGQLAGGIAHDFNNMLSGILGAAELLEFHCKDDEKAKKFIEMIIQSGRRAGNLANKLLIFARKGEIESLPLEVSKAIIEATAILKHSLDKRINIEISIITENTSVVGDLTQLQNALINLGLNAGHAMPEGGGLYFQVDLINLDKEYCAASPFDIQAGQYLDIEVRDTGVGIPVENIHQIFEPFFTTRKQGEGSGLGLAAVYGTVQQHNGAITVYSELGTGTAFHLFLPLAKQHSSSTSASIQTPITGSGKILVVDDEQVIRTTVKIILENLGYEVLLAENGLHGLDIFKNKFTSIDLVILDMIMPKMNGKECFLAMKEIFPDVKVLLASGFSQDTDVETLKEEGSRGFLRKPYSTAELSKAIVKALS